MSDRDLRRAERRAAADPSDEVAAERARAERRRAGLTTIKDVRAAAVKAALAVVAGRTKTWVERCFLQQRAALAVASDLGLPAALRGELLEAIRDEVLGARHLENRRGAVDAWWAAEHAALDQDSLFDPEARDQARRAEADRRWAEVIWARRSPEIFEVAP